MIQNARERGVSPRAARSRIRTLRVPPGRFASLPLLILCGALAAALAPPLLARGSFYVDGANPACSDAGPGTAAAPYCTISAAANAQGGPGTTLYVMPGVYREEVDVEDSGSPGNPFVFQALGSPVLIDGADDLSSASLWTPVSDTVWVAPSVRWETRQVMVDGSRLSRSALPPALIPPGSFSVDDEEGLYVNIGGDSPGVHQAFAGRRAHGFRLAGVSWVTIDGFAITRQEDRGIYLLAGASNCHITSNSVSFANRYGIAVSRSPHAFIASNVVSYCNDHGIHLSAGTFGCVVQDNESFRNARPTERAANGLSLSTSSNNLIQRNRWHDNQDTGQNFYLFSSNNISLQNLSWNNGDHGFDHVRSTGTIHVGDVAWHNFKDGFSIEGFSNGTTLIDCIAADNGLLSSEFDLWVESTSTAGFSSDYGIFWNSTSQIPIKYGGIKYSTLAAFSAATEHDIRSIQADPRFVDPEAGDFHLRAGSPAIDSADASPSLWPALDAEGMPRADIDAIADSGTGLVTYADRGAFEFHSDCGVEICDGRDNDCDGSADEGFDTGACSAGVGACAVRGTFRCSEDGMSSACDAVPDLPSAETCDSLDNDCDGTLDNGYGVGVPCSAGVGACRASGVTICTEDHASIVCGASAGAPLPEVCDGLDNDCDGALDNGQPGAGVACGSDLGQCRPGLRSCRNGRLVCVGEIRPTAERCDGLDNDCDGSSDDGFDVGAACTVGIGACESAGTKACSGDGLATVCSGIPGTPAPERCDRRDNDCDGVIDNGFDVGSPCSAGLGACALQGTRSCSADGTAAVCGAVPGRPAAEACDGVDNDCDGSVDEGFDAGSDCVAGIGACMRHGTKACSPDKTTAVCGAVAGAPAPEICDGLDNDCDGRVDNGFDVGTICTAGSGPCVTSGSRICAPDGSSTRCSAVSRSPSPELCDGLDNDCDGTLDNHAMPAGPLELAVTEDNHGTHLAWGPMGNATSYDAVKGDLLTLKRSRGNFTSATTQCLVNNGLAMPILDTGSIIPGSGAWFLVRGVNACGEGSYDSGGTGQVGGRDAEIRASSLSCP